ncbi:MAG: hypothetical protein GWN47_00805 [Woeseiaceae bacterium]|nr:hypothetical protein [Woeseiaceae bacterium]
MNPIRKTLLLPSIVIAALLVGCASTGTTNTNSDSADADSAFTDFLVIGVAGDYDSRAQFERMLVSGLKAEGATARPYHDVVGGNKPLAREDVLAAVDKYGFDAVVVTRALDTETDFEVRSAVTGTKVKRKEGGFKNLFRYDYEELDEPVSLSLDMKLTFGTELYSAASQSLVWSTESTGRKAENVGELIDETAESVVRQLKRAGKIAR